MKRLSVVVFMAVLLFALDASATIWNVDVADFQFTPAALTILQGDTVIWTNTLGRHGIVSDCDTSAFGHAGAPSPWTYQITATMPVGYYPYHCPIHPVQMTASLTVQRRTSWTVIVRNFSFNPANITITQGDTVLWNDTLGLHDVHHLATPSLFGNTLANAPWTYRFVFSADTTPPGAYPYECTLHLFTGIVNVTVPVTVPAPSQVTINADTTGSHIRLWWNKICHASGYAVFRSTDETADPFPDSLGVTSDTTMTDSTAGLREFYLVRSVSP